ncbi:MAG: hypothetical protein HN919_15100 [Verrucomicrobia bacterium]|nr:hypothetical protein [Verrucomicrobiota bacterium]MBT7701581.1 hypothetical protein [Verrucomicrobiota bacterium]
MNIYPLLAECFREDASLLDEALAVLDRWDEQGVGPIRRRTQWRQVLVAAKGGRDGMDRLLELLLDDGDAARRLKDFGPFAGILSREERRKVFLGHPYDH